VYIVRRRLLKSWGIVRERDYIAEPKSSGYRALHLIVRRMGYPIEVQLRTVGQDAWADTVEETSRQVGVDLKFGAGDERLDRIFLAMAELFARFDRDELSRDDLLEGLRRLPSLRMRTRTQGQSK
jgi:putative GTP pyrophosphokinase